MEDYLRYPLFSKRMNEIINDLIERKNSFICQSLKYVCKTLQNNSLPDHDEFMKIESIRMMDFRRENECYTVSYLPIGKTAEYVDDSEKWSKKNRQCSKIGKTIKKFLEPYLNIKGVKLDDSEVEEFVNDIKAIMSNTNLVFKLVKGDDIKKYYNEKMYDDKHSSTLQNSCMRHDSCSDYFDVYTKNPDCEMLILFDTLFSREKIVGRALIWNKDGQKYMDRRYTSLDMYDNSMIDYAEENKWNYKTYNTYEDNHNTDFQVYNKDTNKYEQKDVNLSYDISDFIEDVSFFPYADTVKYINDGIMSNQYDKNSTFGVYKMDSTEGNIN